MNNYGKNHLGGGIRYETTIFRQIISVNINKMIIKSVITSIMNIIF